MVSASLIGFNQPVFFFYLVPVSQLVTGQVWHIPWQQQLARSCSSIALLATSDSSKKKLLLQHALASSSLHGALIERSLFLHQRLHVKPVHLEADVFIGFPTEPFTISELKDQEIGKFHVDQECSTAAFGAPNLWKGRSGSFRRTEATLSLEALDYLVLDLRVLLVF